MNLGDMTKSLSPTFPESSVLGTEQPRVHAQSPLVKTRHQLLSAESPKCEFTLVPRMTGRRVSRH